MALVAVIVAYLVFASLFALKVPKWNAPDEPAHFNYIRHLAATGTFPVLQPGDYNQEYLEKLKPAQFPDSLPIDTIRYESHQPPLYYVLGAAVYRLTEGASLSRQVLALRGLSILFGALFILAIYALSRETVLGQPLVALGAAAFAAGVPMQLAMSAAVENDSLSELVLTVVLLVLVSGLRSGFGPGRSITLGVLLGLALLTKVTIYSALLLAPVALWVRWRQGGAGGAGGQRRGDRPVAPTGSRGAAVLAYAEARAVAALVRQLAVVYGVALLVSGWWFVRNALTYGWLDPLAQARHAAVVVGQPRTVYNWAALEYLATTTFQSFWAQFGWMGVLVDRRLYQALLVFSVIVAIGLALWLYRAARGRAGLDRESGRALWLLALCFAVTVGEFLYYNLTFVQAQGRYLFPALGPIGIFSLLGLLALAPRRLHVPVVVGLYGALLALDYVCLFRFVAPYFGTA